MRIYRKWVGRQPAKAGEMYLLECSQEEQFTQMFPLIGQQALHATSGARCDIQALPHMRGRAENSACR